jgi:hypothetical protein
MKLIDSKEGIAFQCLRKSCAGMCHIPVKSVREEMVQTKHGARKFLRATCPKCKGGLSRIVSSSWSSS